MLKRLPTLVLLPLLCGFSGIGLGCRGRTPSAPDGPPGPRHAAPPRAVTARAPAVGSPAPDFALPGVDGRTHRLAQLIKGGAAIVVFYRGHW